MPSAKAIRVLMLDDTENSYEVKPASFGNALLQAIMKDLDILESDYFGATYDNGEGSISFLDPLRQINRQIKHINNTVLHFVVKFFPPDPCQMEEEYTRYMFALQVKRDINSGILPCVENTALKMASYIVQAEFGDWNAVECSDTSYLQNLKIFPNPNQEQLQTISNHHTKLIGQSPSEADYNLLDIARRLDHYGIRMHAALDHENSSINLAVSSTGIIVFQGNMKINSFNWSRIRKLSFKRKRFLVKLRADTAQQSETCGDVLVFIMKNRNCCKDFWRLCIEHHAFFRLEIRPRPKPKPLILSRGSSFHYSGKTQKELLELVRNSNFRRSNFVRTTSRRRVQNSTSTSALPLDRKKILDQLNAVENINKSNNSAQQENVTSPSGSSLHTENSFQAREQTDTYQKNDSTTTAEVMPYEDDVTQAEWQLESKSLHSSATPITDEKIQQEPQEMKGNLPVDLVDMENGPETRAEELDIVPNRKHPDIQTSSISSFNNSTSNNVDNKQFTKNDSNVTSALRNGTAKIVRNALSEYFCDTAAKGVGDFVVPMQAHVPPPLPPKERQLSNEGTYDNVSNDSKVSQQGESTDKYVSSSGIQQIGDRQVKDPFVNDSVVNLAGICPTTPEINARIGELKIRTGHYSVPKKPPPPSEENHILKWDRQHSDREIDEAMRQLYNVIGKRDSYDDTNSDNEQDLEEGDEDGLEYIITESKEDTVDGTPCREDPLLAPIKMEFNDDCNRMSSYEL